MLMNFSYHVGEIMTAKAPCAFKLYLGDATAEVKITPAGDGWETPDRPGVWDQVEINGKWCGNRCGGRDEYARLCASELAAAAARK